MEQIRKKNGLDRFGLRTKHLEFPSDNSLLKNKLAQNQTSMLMVLYAGQKETSVLSCGVGVFRLRWGIKEFYSAIWDALLGTEEIWAALFSNHMLVKKQTGT